MKIRFFLLVALLICQVALALLLGGCGAKEETVPAEVTELVHTYLETCKEKGNSTEAAAYMHFEDDFILQAYLDSGDRLLEYQVEGIRKINEDLYEVELLCKSQSQGWRGNDQMRQAWNFVCRIDGKWYYLNGVRHIPAELRSGLNEDRYVYNDTRIVPAEDVIREPIAFD